MLKISSRTANQWMGLANKPLRCRLPRTTHSKPLNTRIIGYRRQYTWRIRHGSAWGVRGEMSVLENQASPVAVTYWPKPTRDMSGFSCAPLSWSCIQMALNDLQRLRRIGKIQMTAGLDYVILSLVSDRTHQRLKSVCNKKPIILPDNKIKSRQCRSIGQIIAAGFIWQINSVRICAGQRDFMCTPQNKIWKGTLQNRQMV